MTSTPNFRAVAAQPCATPTSPRGASGSVFVQTERVGVELAILAAAVVDGCSGVVVVRAWVCAARRDARQRERQGVHLSTAMSESAAPTGQVRGGNARRSEAPTLSEPLKGRR